MRDGELDPLTAVVDRVVEGRVVADLIGKQVRESVLALETFAAVVKREAGVQVGVVLEPMRDEFLVPGEIGEYLAIGREANESPVWGIRALAGPIRLESNLSEFRGSKLAVSPARDFEVPTPFKPTENWKTSSLYLPPVLIWLTQSTSFPSGIPRPKSLTAIESPSRSISIRFPLPMMNSSTALSTTSFSIT
jgi:hypothetical protein